MADVLQPRGYFCLVTVDGLIYAVGGFNGGVIGGVEKFDPERNSWTEVSDLSVAVAALAAVTMERRRLGEATQRNYGSDGREGPGQGPED